MTPCLFWAVALRCSASESNSSRAVRIVATVIGFLPSLIVRRQRRHGQREGQDKDDNAYDKGQGVPQDYAEAVRWYRKVAEQGNASAQFNLGVMYDSGRPPWPGTPQSCRS